MNENKTTKPAIGAAVAKRLRKAVAAMVEEPRRADMDIWSLKLKPGEGTATSPPCGTIGCLAGWVVEQSPKAQAIRKQLTMTIYPTAEAARQVLGDDMDVSLRGSRYYNLFFVDQWPEDFMLRLRDTFQGSPEYAQVIAERVEHFIQHGE